MKNYKSAFTMIELIFVIVIIGILGSMAVTRFGNMKNTTDLATTRSDIAALRSAIMTERQRSLVQGTPSYITKLTPDYTADTSLFTGDGGIGTEPARTLLTYGLKAGTGAGEWEANSGIKYTYHSATQETIFDYNVTNGSFNCTEAAGNDCKALSN